MSSVIAFALTSQVSYKKIVEMEAASPGDSIVEMNGIPKHQWNKYDGNKNWKMSTEGEVVFQRAGSEPATHVVCVFRLLGKTGKVLKTETHLCPINKYSAEEIQMASARLAEAKEMVASGRGDEIADEAFWDRYPTRA